VSILSDIANALKVPHAFRRAGMQTVALAEDIKVETTVDAAGNNSVQDHLDLLRARGGFRGSWDVDATYAYGEIVVDYRNLYSLRVNGHTGGARPLENGSDWAILTVYQGNWTSGETYPFRGIVRHNGVLYIAHNSSVSGTTSPDMDSTNWGALEGTTDAAILALIHDWAEAGNTDEIPWAKLPFSAPPSTSGDTGKVPTYVFGSGLLWRQPPTGQYQGDWSPTATYNEGNVVFARNSFFRCLTEGHLSGYGPFSDPTNWAPVTIFGGDWSVNYWQAGMITEHNNHFWMALEQVTNTDPEPGSDTDTKWMRLDNFTLAEIQSGLLPSLVKAYARIGNTTLIPAGDIHTDIARTSQIPAGGSSTPLKVGESGEAVGTGGYARQNHKHELTSDVKNKLARVPAASSSSTASQVWRCNSAGTPGWRDVSEFSGNYNDLSNKPTIPSPGSATPSKVGESGQGTGDGTGWARGNHTHQLADDVVTKLGRIPAASPGNNKVWKTDGSGTPGWRDDAQGVAGSGEANVQSNWTETDTASDSFIQNKPTIPSVASATPSSVGETGEANGSGTGWARGDHTHQLASGVVTKLGRIPSSQSNANMVWSTDADGNVGWHRDMTLPPDWDTSVSYAVGDYVLYDGSVWEAQVAHSGVSPGGTGVSETNWSEVLGSDSITSGNLSINYASSGATITLSSGNSITLNVATSTQVGLMSAAQYSKLLNIEANALGQTSVDGRITTLVNSVARSSSAQWPANRIHADAKPKGLETAGTAAFAALGSGNTSRWRACTGVNLYDVTPPTTALVALIEVGSGFRDYTPFIANVKNPGFLTRGDGTSRSGGGGRIVPIISWPNSAASPSVDWSQDFAVTPAGLLVWGRPAGAQPARSFEFVFMM